MACPADHVYVYLLGHEGYHNIHDLTEALDYSETTLRKAAQELVASGIVESMPGGGRIGKSRDHRRSTIGVAFRAIAIPSGRLIW